MFKHVTRIFSRDCATPRLILICRGRHRDRLRNRAQKQEIDPDSNPARGKGERLRDCGKERQNLSDLLPALVILCGVLNGILPPIVFDFSGLATHLGCAVPLTILSFIIMPRRRAVFFMSASLLGVISLQVINYRHARNCRSIPVASERGARIVVRIVDPACCGPGIPWLPNPALLRADIIRVKFQGDTHWREVSGRIALRLPRDTPLVSYGDILEFNGSFSARQRGFTEERIIPGDDTGADGARISSFRLTETVGSRGFARYLKTRGMKHVFVARNYLGQTDNRRGVYGLLLELRNSVLRLATADIAAESHRRMLATLLFGCRQGVDRETKRAYIQSGTIHIFTVSGLHVGILALMLFWALRWAPFRGRYVAMPLLIAVYVAITGMQPPAARALLMLTVWCWSRAFLLNIPTFNVVLLAASLLLLKNPYYVQDMGFQFSFLVVGFLVAAGRNLREWIDLSCEARRWIPDAKVDSLSVCRYQCTSKFIAGAGGCLVAWLAGSGIALYYQGIFFPFSIIANFILIPIVLLMFNLIFLKIAIGWLSWPAMLVTGILDAVIGWVNGIVVLVDELFNSMAAIRPGPGSLLLFYLFLSASVMARTRLRLMIGIGGLAGVIIFWHAAGRFMAPGVILLHGGEAREPSVIIHEPAIATAMIVNVPTFEAAECIVELLARRGIRKISRVAFAGNSREYSAGADALFARLEVDEVLQLEPGRRGRNLTAMIERAVERGVAWRQGRLTESADIAEFAGTQLNIKRGKHRLTVAYESLFLHIRVMIESLAPGRRRVTIWDGRGAEVEFDLTNSSILEVKEYVAKK